MLGTQCSVNTVLSLGIWLTALGSQFAMTREFPARFTGRDGSRGIDALAMMGVTRYRMFVSVDGVQYAA